MQDFYSLPFDQFAKLRPWRFNRVDDLDALNRSIATETVDAIEAAGRAGRQLLIITPIGPLDFSRWAELCNQQNVSCEPLVTLNMDEYLNEEGAYIDFSHPMSFRRCLTAAFVDHLNEKLRPDPANLHFPDPHEPAKTTALVESFGGADLCFSGFGITGHFAFNDPPQPHEPCDDDAIRNSRVRTLTIMRETQVQMCMGGTHGNRDIIHERAVTLGMYELLMSKKIHLTFMRSWHAGVLRRALFGPVTGWCPGSFLQEHPNVEVTLTRLAAEMPILNVLQDSGEENH